MRTRWVVLAVTVCLTGCGEPPELAVPAAPETPEAPATQPAPPPLPREPVAVEPALLRIDGEHYLLPPVHLHVMKVDEGLDLQMYSSDVASQATGNTLYLGMQVPAEAWTDLRETPWRFDSPDPAWTDSPQGLTLGEGRWVARPAAVSVQFEPGESVVNVRLSGAFLVWDLSAQAAVPPRRVQVEGSFVAAVVGG